MEPFLDAFQRVSVGGVSTNAGGPGIKSILLRDQTVEKISEDLNFSNSCHFSRKSKSVTGLSPSAHRDRHRDEQVLRLSRDKMDFSGEFVLADGKL